MAHRFERSRPNPQRPHLVVDFNDNDISEGVRKSEKSLIGKLITRKSIHREALASAMLNIWGSPAGFKMEEPQPDLFQFFFDEEDDKNRVLSGSPWVFRNDWLILQQWQRNLEDLKGRFESVGIWVQMWGLPVHCRAEKLGRKLASVLGPVKETGIFSLPNGETFLKALVDFQVSSTRLLDGVMAKSEVDGSIWVEFNYERLCLFCYFCGIVGHDEYTCVERRRGKNESRRLGSWIKANTTGRRISNNNNSGRENQDEKNPRMKNPHSEMKFEHVTKQMDELKVGNCSNVESSRGAEEEVKTRGDLISDDPMEEV